MGDGSAEDGWGSEHCSPVLPPQNYHPLTQQVWAVLLSQKGKTIDAPPKASGHAVGQPGETVVADALRQALPNQVFMPTELLVVALTAPENVTLEQRAASLGSRARAFLLDSEKPGFVKGKRDMLKPKQDDTADICVREPEPTPMADAFMVLIDVKTSSGGGDKKQRGPNIISAEKLSKALVLIRDDPSDPDFDFLYCSLSYRDSEAGHIIAEVAVVDLFRVPPADIYINWTAGSQIQMDIAHSKQTFTGDRREWAKQMLQHIYESNTRHVEKGIDKNDVYRQRAEGQPG